MKAHEEAQRLLRLQNPQEPVFVLRGQDALAPEVVLYWVALAIRHGVPDEKVQEARRWAEEMREWQPRKVPD
jgi:hypothetical protein